LVFWALTLWNGLHQVWEQFLLGMQKFVKAKFSINVITTIRGLSTGIYTTSTAEECHHILENSRANIVVVEDQNQLNKILEVFFLVLN